MPDLHGGSNPVKERMDELGERARSVRRGRTAMKREVQAAGAGQVGRETLAAIVEDAPPSLRVSDTAVVTSNPHPQEGLGMTRTCIDCGHTTIPRPWTPGWTPVPDRGGWTCPACSRRTAEAVPRARR